MPVILGIIRNLADLRVCEFLHFFFGELFVKIVPYIVCKCPTLQTLGSFGRYSNEQNIYSSTDQSGKGGYLAAHAPRRLGLVESETSMRLYGALKSGIAQLETAPIDRELLRLRMVKDEEECAAIRRACEITDFAFTAMCRMIRPGVTEAAIDRFLQDYMRGFPEVERMAERFIVASGPRGSMPHGLASERALCEHEFVTVDFGCNCGGYWSDVTRTVCVGEPSAKQREIYEIVLAAQNAAISLAAPGKTGRELDSAARKIITDAGYGAYFGLNIHEAPQCAQNENGDIPLQPGMIITAEPGIYIPQFGRVRIEDDILITENGCVDLTQADKQLIVL